MIGMSFPQLFDNGEPSNLENLRKFFDANYNISQIETSEIGRNGIRVCFLNDVTGIVENGYLVRVWGIQKDITSSNSKKAILKQLTLEQLNVLKATVEGKTMKEIASDVGVSPKTVESIRAQLKTIFGVDTIARLIAVVIQIGIQSIQ
jgi:DNA-binding CsgD family transcriptional regulator